MSTVCSVLEKTISSFLLYLISFIVALIVEEEIIVIQFILHIVLAIVI